MEKEVRNWPWPRHGAGITEKQFHQPQSLRASLPALPSHRQSLPRPEMLQDTPDTVLPLERQEGIPAVTWPWQPCQGPAPHQLVCAGTDWEILQRHIYRWEEENGDEEWDATPALHWGVPAHMSNLPVSSQCFSSTSPTILSQFCISILLFRSLCG